MSSGTAAGARWLRCDLHVHTPFDRTKQYGEDVTNAIIQHTKGNSGPLRRMAWDFFDRCRNAQLDLVAITDHNSIDGFRLFRRFLNEWRHGTGANLEVLPGVEITVGGERNLHVLLICQKDTDPAWIDQYLSALFNARPRLDEQGRPYSCQRTVVEFCKFTRDCFEEKGYSYLLIPAHINRPSGIDSELRSADPPIWEKELRNTLRERAFMQRHLGWIPGSRGPTGHSSDRIAPPSMGGCLFLWKVLSSAHPGRAAGYRLAPTLAHN